MKSANDAHYQRIRFDCRPSYVLLGALFLLAMLLAGCPAPLRSVTGPEVEAPEGFELLCRQIPTPVECGGK